MNIGIVTTWFERGASYVSKQFEQVLKKRHVVYIYARGGENYGIGDPNWDKENVTWGLRRNAPFSGTLISKRDFVKWITKNKIEFILFNEQEWWYPVLWCNELKIPTVCYIDYYKVNTIPLYSAYSALICNTKRHYSAFDWHPKSFYIPWGTDCDIFCPPKSNFKLVNDQYITFFHSCGMNPYRKGTDILLQASEFLTGSFKLVIHSQVDLKLCFNGNIIRIIDKLVKTGNLIIVNETIPAPGLYHLGDVYIYPSRLEGIGLTIAEAEACGLVPVVTDNGPMNEFVKSEIGFLIETSNFFAREDGYYWPECTPSIISLKKIMAGIISDKEKIVALKEANFKYAFENLNWEKNSSKIFEIFELVKFEPLDDSVRKSILSFEEKGFRKILTTYLKYYWILNWLSKLLKKIF